MRQWCGANRTVGGEAFVVDAILVGFATAQGNRRIIGTSGKYEKNVQEKWEVIEFHFVSRELTLWEDGLVV